MKKKYIFSKVEGQLLKNGKPLEGIRIEQCFSWISVKGDSKTVASDKEGKFSFPEITAKKLPKYDEIFIMQNLFADIDGERYILWNHCKQNLETGGETGLETIVLTADIARPECEYKIPISSSEISLVWGTVGVQLDHPYLKALEDAKQEVSAEKVAKAMSGFLNSQESLNHINSFFFEAGESNVRPVKVKYFRTVEMSDFYLCSKPEKESFSYDLDFKYIEFTLSGRTLVGMDTGMEIDIGFFAGSVFVDLESLKREEYNIAIPGKWEVDNREYQKNAAMQILKKDKLEKLALDTLNSSMWESVKEAFPEAEKNGAIEFKDLDICSYEVLHIKEDRLLVSLPSEVNVLYKGEERKYSIDISFAVDLASLAEDDYKRLELEEETPYINIYKFRVDLSMNKAKYALGEPMLLNFIVTNLMLDMHKFLKWHTPFEGFANEFLQVENVNTREKIDYCGILRSRVAPCEDDYLKIKPEKSQSTEIEINEAYPIKKKGVYSLSYSGYGRTAFSEDIRFEVE